MTGWSVLFRNPPRSVRDLAKLASLPTPCPSARSRPYDLEKGDGLASMLPSVDRKRGLRGLSRFLLIPGIHVYETGRPSFTPDPSATIVNVTTIFNHLPLQISESDRGRWDLASLRSCTDRKSTRLTCFGRLTYLR